MTKFAPKLSLFVLSAVALALALVVVGRGPAVNRQGSLVNSVKSGSLKYFPALLAFCRNPIRNLCTLSTGDLVRCGCIPYIPYSSRRLFN